MAVLIFLEGGCWCGPLDVVAVGAKVKGSFQGGICRWLRGGNIVPCWRECTAREGTCLCRCSSSGILKMWSRSRRHVLAILTILLAANTRTMARASCLFPMTMSVKKETRAQTTHSRHELQAFLILLIVPDLLTLEPWVNRLFLALELSLGPWYGTTVKEEISTGDMATRQEDEGERTNQGSSFSKHG